MNYKVPKLAGLWRIVRFGLSLAAVLAVGWLALQMCGG